MSPELILYVVIGAIPVLIGFVFGRTIEANHFRRLARREAETSDILTFSERFPPEGVSEGVLVSGSVALAQDGFKALLASLRMFFGGRIATYEQLVHRARREAVLRMKDDARAKGADLIFNVKFVTSNIAASDPRRPTLAVEVLAFGTAVHVTRGGVDGL